MSEQDKWSWWVGHDDEHYHTECDTREEAVRIATEEQDGGYIVEAKKPANIKISSYFDGQLFAENAEERAQDDHGDLDGGAEIFPVSNEQLNELQSLVRSTIDAWQAEQGLVFTGWRFSEFRNQEYVPEPQDDDTPVTQNATEIEWPR
ncbi:hypothetical protein [Tritonibacter mobilis]|uniref:hypothetical protein n=1 Tax=Tritonibacter mobilis TaxID=379347 RepID=UPI001C096DE4|nr:hypothetical protein [Tritonibacter mobilis]MBU3035950.1 hypothetical protein [Tritonibacter mobilis]WHQ85368.1 hypothetical protein OMR53_21820 [Tritonibacter mobilis]